MVDWAEGTLSHVATVVGRGITPKYADDGETVVINQRCIRDGRVNTEFARRHDSGKKPVRPDKLLVRGDVLVNSTGVGTLGRTAPVKNLGSPASADSHVTIVRPAADTDAGWLAYAILVNEPVIEAMAEGSTGQTELSRHRLAELELLVPPLHEQRGIAATLGALDDKIESNLRARQLMRELGRSKLSSAIERSTGRRLRLCDVTLSISRGVSPKYADDDPSAPLVLNQRCIRDTWVSVGAARRMLPRRVSEAKRVGSGDILVNSTGTGTLGRVGRWHDGEIFADSHVSIVKPDPAEVDPTVLAYSMFDRQTDIEDMATGSTGQTELSATRLGELELELPGKEDSRELELVLVAIEQRVAQLRAEEEWLVELRDVLLPELLTGRIRVPEVAEAIEEVLV